jgi:acetyltransferase-like isoleucine patch superfamily enzyme
MAAEPGIRHGQYSEVEYRQFRPSPVFATARAVAGILTWPVVWPLALLCRASDDLFRTASECLSLVPYVLGVVVRGEFYRFALRRCGRNVVVEFGTVFIYRDVVVGEHVLIGRYNTIHHCDFGSYVLIAEHCAFLSGSRYHSFDRTDIPMALQGGKKKRIAIGDDCWIGAHAVVMDDVGRGAVVGAGAVVTQPVPEYTIVAGNPAREVRRREFAARSPSPHGGEGDRG